MTMEEKKLLNELIDCVKGDARLSGEAWTSLAYWSRGIGVSLRRFRYYNESIRVDADGDTVDFHLYIGLNDNLVVFNALLKELPLLKKRLLDRYGFIKMDFAGEPARDAGSGEIKESMVMAHFHIPLEEKDMLRDVYCEVYAIAQRIEKGKEVRPRGGQAEKAVDNERRGASDFSMRPIPDVKPAEGAMPSCDVNGVISWVTTVEDLFDRKVITLSDGRKMSPGRYVIPPYQRKYAWVYENVSQLCRDLLKAEDAGKASYHLGTVILHHQDASDTSSDTFYVVDGQQRLTTISQMLGEEIFDQGDQRGAASNLDESGRSAIRAALDEYERDLDSIRDMLRRSTLVMIAVDDINEAFQLFSTQNGRGRPLTPANLLKAYHLHELEPEEAADAARIDEEWEANNTRDVRDGKLLNQVLGEHLYRLRCWSRGDFPTEGFSNADIAEFKGITLWNEREPRIPAQNLMRLRVDAHSGEEFSRRSVADKMDLLVTIDQPIANGANFFTYVSSYAEAYRTLFVSDAEDERRPIKDFKDFYQCQCINYEKSWRRGDTYARHVFESLCLFCYDRFAVKGLVDCQKSLYQCAYFERAVKSRCYYSTCGSEFAMKAVREMMSCMTLADLKDRLHALSVKIRAQYAKEAPEMQIRGLPPGIAVVRSVFEK
jgi:hypothetical protein